MKKRVLKVATMLAAIGTIAALAGCSGAGTGTSSDQSKADPKAKVTITVGDEPTADKKADRANFLKQLQQFEKMYPNITVKPSTEYWQAQTFQAKLAGGTLPDTMNVSLTYSKQLIANKQLPNMTPYLKQIGLLDDLNPLALKNVQDANGDVYTVPYGLFSVGISYNRALFTKAGLDPNKPPTTWDEVRADAKQIHDKVPGVAGYAQLTTNNTGGWMLTAMTYSMGGTVTNKAGTKTDMGSATEESLQLLHDMRWTDNSMGSQFLYNQDDIRKAFSAGKIGIVMQAPDIYGQAIPTYGMKPADFGQGALPQANGTNGTLTGGTIAMFNAKATPNQLLAAAKWVKFMNFQQYFDKDLAVQNATANAADGTAVGVPGLPPVTDAINNRYLGWIKDQINVPLDQFKGYTSSTLPLIPEPADAQNTYAALDPVVQKVLTDKNADIKQLVQAAGTTIDRNLSQAAG
ncbi:ABC transporter substrate-binding protein [Humibacter sp. RRB41]|uniref:ABC transporter substrate-binding protein n=1 Tax=Humibacter sp. RRB41 TaxID=2919946 RepID=UPI001FAA09C0|nr:ABC transporter substrate-binding protein [Humibacter sp. RRB41]